MKKDIYAKKPRKTSNKIIKYYPIANNRQKLDELENIKSQLDKVESIIKASTPLVKVQMPEVQEVEVNNFPEPREVKFPEVQKVEVQNQPKIDIPNNITVKNAEEIGKKIGKYIVFPKNVKAEMTNFVKPQVIPIGRGNIPGKADPEEYIPVRLTTGKKFYNALEDAYVAAAKAVRPPLWATTTTSGLAGTQFMIKSSAGTFGGYYYYNPNATAVYIQVFDSLNPTLGVDKPKLTYGVPATGGANIEIGNGIGFANGITAFATTSPFGSTPPTTGIPVNFYFL